MAENDTMLSHLALRLTSRTEDLAVEALGYILNSSESAKGALAELVGVDSAILDRVQTQVVIENGRPDLVCFEGDARRVVIEAKFWAYLGYEQAKYYLEKLSDSGVLLFVGPDARLDNLWAEVKRDVATNLGPDIVAASTRRTEVVGTQKRLMLVSWEHLLNAMSVAASGSPDVQSDIRQLQGLTRRMDEEALLPFSKDDLSPQLARRMRDLRIIYDDVTSRIRNENWVTAWYGTSRYLQSAYGQFCQISGIGSWFGVSYRLWARGDCEETPFWLELNNCPHSILAEIDNRLNVKTVNHKSIPIRLKSGVERQEIVDSIVGQLDTVSQIIREAS